MDADAFEESDDEDRREAGEISDDGSSNDDDDAGVSDNQHHPVSPDSPPPLNVAPEAAGAYELNSFPHTFFTSPCRVVIVDLIHLFQLDLLCHIGRVLNSTPTLIRNTLIKKMMSLELMCLAVGAWVISYM